jgi:transcriptional regulator with XRE-family HTH domain
MADLICLYPQMVRKLDNPPNRIREVRKGKGMTLEQVAVQLGTTKTQIARFETGDRDPTLEWLRRIARVLGVDVGQLLSAEDNETSLDAVERAVVRTMRSGGPQIAQTVYRVAEGLGGFDAGPADTTQPEPPARRRA